MGYQYAIEETYWRHRIWPEGNLGPKPALDAIVSQRQIEQKVENYLSKSQFVTGQRGSPITSRELQAEMDRMAQHTKQPEVLRELFAALENDPFVIAECLARPVLAERLSANLTMVAGMPPAARTSFAAGTAASIQNRFRVMANQENVQYKLPEVVVPEGCADGSWTAASTVNAPDEREGHTAVWTGTEMIIWGGENSNGGHVNPLDTGGKYNPAEDTWTATSTTNAPIARAGHTAVWTGTEMIIWGGATYPAGQLDTGGRYNPSTDSWTPTSTANVPTARELHTAVWTGNQMIVWGGTVYNGNGRFNSGGRYNPSTDSWTPTSTINAPEARWYHTVEWTGSEMIIWGGTNQTIYLNTGGRYDPATDTWITTGVPNVVLGRAGHTAGWTGTEMIVWGGADSTFNDTNTGGTYDPTSDSWAATSTANAPSARDSHTAVWTGNEMIVWGGVFCCPAIDFNTGGRYNPDTDSWTATSTADAPLARFYHTAVWTGTEMIIWGGYNHENNMFLNTGGRYCAQAGPTPTPTPTSTPTPTATPIGTPTATPTSTPRATPTPRTAPTPRLRPTPHPRP